MPIILQTSNAYKLSEYQRLLEGQDIEIQKGKDLREVLGTIDEVITYKVLAAGENVLVEDTALIINGKEEVEIKWKADTLKSNDKISFIVSIGIFRKGRVQISQSKIDAVVNRSLGTDGVDFEPYIIPLLNNPDKLSYTQLSKAINKDIIDPRSKALQNFLSNNFKIDKDIMDIPVWKGEFQNED